MTAEQLKEMRKILGMTQSQFGNKITASQAQISSWENGLYKIPEWAAKNIERIFLAEVDQAAGVTTDPPNESMEVRQRAAGEAFEDLRNFYPTFVLLERQMHFLQLAKIYIESSSPRLMQELRRELEQGERRQPKKKRDRENPGAVARARPPRQSERPSRSDKKK